MKLKSILIITTSLAAIATACYFILKPKPTAENIGPSAEQIFHGAKTKTLEPVTPPYQTANGTFIYWRKDDRFYNYSKVEITLSSGERKNIADSLELNRKTGKLFV